MSTYTAAARQNSGREAWLIEFRHPLRLDAGKPGKKLRKGLGTSDREKAERWAAQMNELLGNDALWSLGARGEAEKLFDAEVVEIFYSEIEPRTVDASSLRDKLLPLPARQDGYCKVAMLGAPGAGKTTLIRQFLGTNPRTEAFPPTSLNRTTTFPAEFILQKDRLEAVITFLSEHETRFEIEECVSSAVIEAIDGDRSKVTSTFLEKSDMRFRLKYALGDAGDESPGEDPYAEDGDGDVPIERSAAFVVTAEEARRNAALIAEYVDRIIAIAERHRVELEEKQGPLAAMSPADRAAALDLIEEQADASDEFLELVSDILDELRTKFEPLSAHGKFDKTVTGWPRAWFIKAKPDARAEVLDVLRMFAGNNVRQWGKLLTPLVNGMRVKWPSHGKWVNGDPRLILLDTEGLGHKASATADLPEQTSALLHEADVILLVENAKNGFTNYSTGKALESIANTGHTRKLAIVFTHMDLASASGLKGQRLYDQMFAGLRNIVDNQLSKTVSAEAARFVLESVQQRTFYLGRLDRLDPKGAESELNRLLEHLMKEQPPIIRPVSLPQYNSAFLLLALQEAARDFRRQWQGYLSIQPDPFFKPEPWQRIKALTRRYAEGWGESFELRPTANLRTVLETAVARFLEGPVGWTGEPTPEEKRASIEQLKQDVTGHLQGIARRRLRELPQGSWKDAWAPRGLGSTTTRRIRVESIYERWVPIPEIRGDQTVLDFMQEVEQLLTEALESFKKRVLAKSKADG